MGTKLIVSIDGLKLSNLNQVVLARSIDEVIVVNSSAGFNNLDNGTLTAVSIKSSLANNNISMSLAFANETSVTLDNDFYNFVGSAGLSFVNDLILIVLVHLLSLIVVL